MKNKTILKVILIIFVLAGIIITGIWGLNFSLSYSAHKEIDIYIGKEFDSQEIYNLAKETLTTKEISVQKVELYKDMVSIQVKEINDEQLENLNTKINEKYGIENKKEDILVTSVANLRGRDLIKPYIFPILISTVIILLYITLYIVIRNHIEQKNINVFKKIGKAILLIIVVELLYLAFLAITRVSINVYTIPIGIILYAITTIIILKYLQKDYQKNEK